MPCKRKNDSLRNAALETRDRKFQGRGESIICVLQNGPYEARTSESPQQRVSSMNWGGGEED